MLPVPDVRNASNGRAPAGGHVCNQRGDEATTRSLTVSDVRNASNGGAPAGGHVFSRQYFSCLEGSSSGPRCTGLHSLFYS